MNHLTERRRKAPVGGLFDGGEAIGGGGEAIGGGSEAIGGGSDAIGSGSEAVGGGGEAVGGGGEAVGGGGEAQSGGSETLGGGGEAVGGDEASGSAGFEEIFSAFDEIFGGDGEAAGEGSGEQVPEASEDLREASGVGGETEGQECEVGGEYFLEGDGSGTALPPVEAFGALAIEVPAREPVDLEAVERTDRENTIALLQAKTRKGVALRPGEKKELRRLLAAQEGKGLVGSLEELATALGVALRTVKYWAAEEGFPVEEEGLYDPEAVATWRAAWGSGRSKATSEEEEEGGEDWEDIKNKYAAKRERLKYERERGAVIDRADVERDWAARVSAVSSGLLALPRVVAPLLVDGMSIEEKEASLSKHVRVLLESYARPLPEEWSAAEVVKNG